MKWMPEARAASGADDVLRHATVVDELLRSEAHISLVMDTDWRRQHVGRWAHPESEAQKVTVDNDRIAAIGRHLNPEAAYGGFLGLARFSAKGAETLKANYPGVVEKFDGRPFRKAPIVRRAYLTDMSQELID